MKPVQFASYAVALMHALNLPQSMAYLPGKRSRRFKGQRNPAGSKFRKAVQKRTFGLTTGRGY